MYFSSLYKPAKKRYNNRMTAGSEAFYEIVNRTAYLFERH